MRTHLYIKIKSVCFIGLLFCTMYFNFQYLWSVIHKNCFLGPLKPRYVRVNTLSITTDEAIQNFQDEDWVLTKFLDKNDYDGFLQKISSLEESEFMVDIHIPNLLIFPPKTEFHNHPAYNKGSILLQDKVNIVRSTAHLFIFIILI